MRVSSERWSGRRLGVVQWAVALASACGGDSGFGSGGHGAAICSPFEEVECFTGPSGTAIGSCRTGIQTCLANGTGFSPCLNEVLPEEESCVEPGADEDCDGAIDEDCVCEIGSTSVCDYDGPPGAEGVGACKAGTRTCLNGKSPGVCQGQVLPSFEDCFFPSDEDCDGASAPQCTGKPLWSAHFDAEGPAHQASAADVAIDASGNVYVTGSFTATLHPSGASGSVTTVAGDSDHFLVKYDASGAHAWTRVLGGPNPGFSDAGASAVAVDAGGNVFVVGEFAGDIVLESQTFSSTAEHDVYVAKLDPSGSFLWARTFAGTGDDGLADAAVDASGNLILIGNLGDAANPAAEGGSLEFMPGASLSANLASHGFVVQLLGSSGSHVWSHLIGNPDDPESTSALTLAVDAHGNSLVMVRQWGVVNWLGVELPQGVYLHEYDAYGAPQRAEWQLSEGVIAPRPNGGIAMVVGIQASEVSVRLFDDSGSVTEATSLVASEGHVSAQAIGVDPAGNVTVGGRFQGTLGSNGTTVTSPSATEAFFVAKLDKNLGLRWIQTFGAPPISMLAGMALGPDGGAAVVGGFKDDLTIGSATHSAVGASDGFLALFAP